MSKSGVDISDLKNFIKLDKSATNLQSEFVRSEELELSVRKQSSFFQRPILQSSNDLINKLSSMFVTQELSPDQLNRTGHSQKVTYYAMSESILVSDSKINGVESNKCLTKPVCLEVGIPENIVVKVESGEGIIYSNPAISEAAFTQEGAWAEKKGQITVYNRLAPANGCFFSAAAFQMAIWYMKHFMLPSLNGVPNGYIFGDTMGEDSRLNPPAVITVYMPQELSTRHSPEALNIVYHALEANDIMLATGLPIIKRVWNMCGDLAANQFTLESFWEAWHILKVSACGTSQSSIFEMDFLLLMIQALPLHGNCNEGGIWRELFKGYRVQQNVGVICSMFNRQTIGYYNINSGQLIAACITVQTIISRVLYETKADRKLFMQPPDCGNSLAKDSVLCILQEIRNSMASATGLSVDYFQHYISGNVLTEENSNRHINIRSCNYFKSYSSFWPSYSVDVPGDGLGQNSYNPCLVNCLVFAGSHSVEEFRSDEALYYEYPMYEKYSFTNGLFWLNPSVNESDGILEMIYDGSTIDGNNRTLSAIPLVDGNILQAGENLGSKIHGDNGDILPSDSNLRTAENGLHLVRSCYIPSYARSGKYSVTITKYSPLAMQRGEAKKQGKGRWELFLNKKFRLENDYGTLRPVNVSVYDFYKEFKRLTDRQASMFTKLQLKNKSRTEEYLAEKIAGKLSKTSSMIDSIKREETHNAVKIREAGLLLAKSELLRKFGRRLAESIHESYTDGGDMLISDCDIYISTMKVLEVRLGSFTFLRRSDLVNTSREQSSKDSSNRMIKPEKIFLIYGYNTTSRQWEMERYVTDIQILQKKAIIEANEIENLVSNSIIPYLDSDQQELVLVNQHDYLSSMINQVDQLSKERVEKILQNSALNPVGDKITGKSSVPAKDSIQVDIRGKKIQFVKNKIQHNNLKSNVSSAEKVATDSLKRVNFDSVNQKGQEADILRRNTILNLSNQTEQVLVEEREVLVEGLRDFQELSLTPGINDANLRKDLKNDLEETVNKLGILDETIDFKRSVGSVFETEKSEESSMQGMTKERSTVSDPKKYTAKKPMISKKEGNKIESTTIKNSMEKMPQLEAVNNSDMLTETTAIRENPEPTPRPQDSEDVGDEA